MIVDAHIDRWHAPPGALHQRPIGGKVDQRREDTAVGVAAIGIHHPFFAPLRLQLDAIVMQGGNLNSKPLVKRRARDQALHFLDGDAFAHGVTTTFPITLRSAIRRRPSAASSSGTTLSITGFSVRASIISISATRFSS